MFRFRSVFWCLIPFIMVSCENFDDLSDPVLNRYDVPADVLKDVFTADIPQNMKNVDQFFDRIREQGMVIHEGNQPPVMFGPTGIGPLKFTVANNCIYDDKNPDNEGFSYGKYEETLRVQMGQNQTNILADIAYASVFNPDYPEYPEGLDSGSGRGYASGEGDDFTIFTKVTNGRYGDISYSAIWIISGTYANVVGSQHELTNVTKCMIMLEKSDDPEDKVANRGTVRVFRDNSPQWIPD